MTDNPRPKSTLTATLFFPIGNGIIFFFEDLGRYFSIVWWMIRNSRNAKEYSQNIFQQMVTIGNNSIPIVLFVATFVGMVTAVQSSYQLYDWIPRTVVGALVTKSVLLELTPLLTALVLAGKVGATITAELGTMRVTEQIDALEALAFDPVSFLITPRVIAGVFMFPLLIIFGDLVAILGGMFGASVVAGIPTEAFISGMKSSFETWDAVFGIIKAVVFGYIITSVASYQGFKVQGGSEGVGKATMNTVVISSLAVVVMDFVLASVLL
ncbi:MAG: ABC transporter permease [Bacteroidota bacterium]|jgi:phospholipid/cholesterol/gamma-HCH transport system permease protein